MGNMINIHGIQSKGDMVKVVYFTDAHNQPTLEQDRFVWLARLVNHEKPDYLIDGGDSNDFHSLCSHERNETQKGKLKPSIEKDLVYAAKAMELINDVLNCNPIKHITLGNHEARIFTYEDKNPEVYGMIRGHYFDILDKHGWSYDDYGEYFTLGGVDFTHCPFNTNGKPIGGENVAKQAATNSIADVVFGHTHQMTIVTSHKYGNARSVTAYNLGCYMPDGYIPSYAQNTRKQFWYGAHVLMISGGRIKSVKSYSIAEMEHRFGQSVRLVFNS